MKICHVDPACGLTIPPKNWGAIEKIIWEFEENQRKLGHESTHKLAGHIRHGEFDIVHCHVANLALDLKQRGIPYIYQLHDHHVLYYGKESQTFKENLEAIDGSLISLMPAKWLVDYFEHPKCVYFAHGVNTKEFYPNSNLKPTPKEPKLLMLANNGMGGKNGHDRKGFAYGVGLAIKRNLPITIVGPRNNENWINENLWVLNYPKLEFIWEPDNKNLRQIYWDHDIFLHPSELEAGHPNLTLLEAAACGLPIIGWIEMETDFHGLWRAPRNIFRMEDGLNDILNNWDNYVKRSIQTGKDFSWENRTKSLMEIYQQVI
jgi:glycosyltransferase involved in cell wall biosynthesis